MKNDRFIYDTLTNIGVFLFEFAQSKLTLPAEFRNIDTYKEMHVHLISNDKLTRTPDQILSKDIHLLLIYIQVSGLLRGMPEQKDMPLEFEVTPARPPADFGGEGVLYQ
jgi:hypothetical protein